MARDIGFRIAAIATSNEDVTRTDGQRADRRNGNLVATLRELSDQVGEQPQLSWRRRRSWEQLLKVPLVSLFTSLSTLPSLIYSVLKPFSALVTAACTV